MSVLTNSACPAIPMYGSISFGGLPSLSSTLNLKFIGTFALKGSVERRQTMRPPSASCDTAESPVCGVAARGWRAHGLAALYGSFESECANELQVQRGRQRRQPSERYGTVHGDGRARRIRQHGHECVRARSSGGIGIDGGTGARANGARGRLG